MPDITMCVNEKCKFRRECYRYRAIPSEFAQTYSRFEPKKDGICLWFVDISNYKPYHIRPWTKEG